MEQKLYYHNSKPFRHFIAWRQNHPHSLHSVVLLIIIIITCTSASINGDKFTLNNYSPNADPDSDSGNEHTRRHAHKYSQTIDSLLSSIKNSKSMILNIDTETPTMPPLPYDAFDGSESVCPTCYFDRNSDELRLEAIKRQILSKLGLKQKPTITLPVPRDVILETLSRAEGGRVAVGRGEERGRGREKGRERERGREKGRGREKEKGAEEEEEEQEEEEKEKEEDQEQQEEEEKRKKKKKKDEEEEEEEVVESEPDDFYGRTSEIISFAEPGQLLNGQTLLEFAHSSESDPGVVMSQLRVKSALLWVRVALNRSLVSHQVAVNKNMTLWVFKVKSSVANTSFLSGKDFDEHTELVGSLSVSLSSLGWQKIDMTAAVREWYNEGRLRKERLRLLVDCSGCKDTVQVLIFQGARGRRVRSVEDKEDPEGHASNISSHGERLDPNRAFLVVHTEPVVMKRSRRRALDCSGAVKGQCCKQNFFVSFKDLKWDDWIIAPKGYHANYCRGDCGGIHRMPDTFLNYHTHVIEEYRKLDRLTGIQPCCAPIKFSSMSLIYFGPDNNIIKRDLPKMVVEQCGCP